MVTAAERAYNHKYYLDHKSYFQNYHRQYVLDHPELKEYYSDYRRGHLEDYARWEREYKLRKLEAEGARVAEVSARSLSHG